MAMPGPPDVKDKSSAAALPSPNLHSLHAQAQHHHTHAHPRPVPPQPYYLDERDGLISWLRGEFAAANAIIDSLSNHLRAIGDPGEYDTVIASINQRRCNWTTILYTQQYFPISDVVYALKQAAWRRRPQAHTSNCSRKEYRRGSFNHNQYHNNNNNNHSSNISGNNLGSGGVKEGVSPGSVAKRSEAGDKDEDVKAVDGDGVGEEGKGAVSTALADPASKNAEAAGETASDGAKRESDKKEGCTSAPNVSVHVCVERNQKVKQIAGGVPKTFVANELIDGITVNIVEGLKLYDLLDDTEVRKLYSLATDLRAAGKRGQFQGQTYVVSKRPMRGHGREMIQLCVPVTDSPSDVENAGIHKEKKIESIPALFQDIIDRLLRIQIVTVKPDSCTIDFYYEGDHSHPHSWPHWYVRPVCMLSLTECDMSFGKTFTINHPGDFKGALKLSLLPGSLLVLQGPAADLAKHAIPPMHKQRMLITFTKHQPKKLMPGDVRVPSNVVQPPHWGPPTPRPLNNVPHPAASKHFGPVSGTTSAMPAPPIHPQISAPNGMPALFVAAPVVPALPYPAPVAIPAPPTGWSLVPPRHPPPPHLAVPGTGVFLPPQGSGNPSSPEQSSVDQNHSTSVSPNGKQADLRKGRPEAKGSVHGLKDSKDAEKRNGEATHYCGR